MIESEILFALAEISVGMAGFSAIVVLFKRLDSGQWLASDADRFNGMLLHSMAAALFCLLPAIIHVIVTEDSRVWLIASSLLGIEILAHAAIIVRLPSTSGVARIAVAAGGLAAGALQLANVFGLGYAREFPPYLVGVLWHVIQAGTLFMMLIWVRAADVRDE